MNLPRIFFFKHCLTFHHLNFDISLIKSFINVFLNSKYQTDIIKKNEIFLKSMIIDRLLI